MDQETQSGWRPTRRQVLWTGGVAAVLTVSVLIGYRYGITLWDWIKLLIVPAVIAAGGLWFNMQQREREQRIASVRAQDDALQAYLDGMSDLLTDKEQPLHQAQPGDTSSIAARARTLTILSRLDSGRKRNVLEFLYESRLILQEEAFLDESNLIERGHNIVSVQQADLCGADLSGAEHITNEELEQRAASLEGATMPNGQRYEDWLTDQKAQGKDEKNE